MSNRLNEISKDKEEKIKQTIEKIANHASELYDMMKPGMTIDIKIPIKKDIIVPNQVPEVKRLYITRPERIFYIKVE